MYCVCGEKWCEARNLCSVDLGTSMGHWRAGEVRVGGDVFELSCDSDCEICHPPTLIPGTSVNWGPIQWATEAATTRVRAVVSLSVEGDPF